MALIPSTRYPAQTDTDAAYPYGKARNAGSFQDGTGTPLERDWLCDLWGFLQSLLSSAAIAPSGVPDEVGASQYLEAMSTIAGSVAYARSIRNSALIARRLMTGTTDENSMAASGAVPGLGTLIMKAGPNNVIVASDMLVVPTIIGSIPSITSLVVGCAYSTALNRLVVIGTGGNRVAYSDNFGSSWTAGANPGAAPRSIVYVAPHDRFLLLHGTVTAQHSVDATAWSDTGDSGDSNTDGTGMLAVLANGNVIGLKDQPTPFFRITTDGNESWGDTGGGVVDATSYDSIGNVAGNAGPFIFHTGHLLSGTKLRVSRSNDGSVWQTVAEFEPPSGTFVGPRVQVCQESGLVVVSCRHNTNYIAFYGSIDQGVTWFGPVVIRHTDIMGASWALANGRLCFTQRDNVYLSDGIAF